MAHSSQPFVSENETFTLKVSILEKYSCETDPLSSPISQGTGCLRMSQLPGSSDEAIQQDFHLNPSINQ